jgi:endogenous inhibitor of DNA gyrase (YacG/DUF329 family)
MLMLKVTCAMCGKEGPELNVTETAELKPTKLEKRLKQLKWIVQFNGSNFDVYCSAKCAK